MEFILTVDSVSQGPNKQLPFDASGYADTTGCRPYINLSLPFAPKLGDRLRVQVEVLNPIPEKYEPLAVTMQEQRAVPFETPHSEIAARLMTEGVDN